MARYVSLALVGQCANECGSVSLTGDCGLGVLIVDQAAGEACLSNVIDVSPSGRCCATTPSPTPPPTPPPISSSPTTIAPVPTPTPPDLQALVSTVAVASGQAAAGVAAAVALYTVVAEAGATEASISAAASVFAAALQDLAGSIAEVVELAGQALAQGRITELTYITWLSLKNSLKTIGAKWTASVTLSMAIAYLYQAARIQNIASGGLQIIDSDNPTPTPTISSSVSTSSPSPTECDRCDFCQPGLGDEPEADYSDGIPSSFLGRRSLPSSAPLVPPIGDAASHNETDGKLTTSPSYKVCGGKWSVTSLLYPSTAQKVTTDPTDANNILAISKFWDNSKSLTRNDWPCDWNLVQIPVPQSGNKYASK